MDTGHGVHTHSAASLSHRKGGDDAISSHRGGIEMIMLSEVSETEKDKYRMILLICRILKNDTDKLIYKQKQTLKLSGQIYGYQWGRAGEGIHWDLDVYRLIHLK